jgi:hypothetical protein
LPKELEEHKKLLWRAESDRKTSRKCFFGRAEKSCFGEPELSEKSHTSHKSFFGDQKSWPELAEISPS